MMKITNDDVAHLATLSQIALTDEETAALAIDLKSIIKYIEQLSELDTTGVEPTYQVTGLSNIWREDDIEKQVSREELLALAPDQKNNQVKVPKVL
ncbi:Asp-tRNA(Asn)/Glu-tRNA(Gln) amidotransferase subunit GatC [Candidatus Saccharibacteria bacterium]|nr:Asp-tRNA(Asn)/Glu-tRNA(Gln) amidotransferase subunit GatC [Candidatus Saccharibacteria bacterium]